MREEGQNKLEKVLGRKFPDFKIYYTSVLIKTVRY